MSRFIISGGGTGGHLSPAIAAAEGLKARGHEPLLLISRKQVDARLIQKYPDLRFDRMPGSGFAWHPWKFLRCLGSQARALVFCLRLIRQMRPAGIIGFGGFTSAPLVLAGWMLGLPSALHESNRVPGRAIRILGRLASRVYLPPGVNVPAIPAAATRHVGLPVRREIVRVPQAAARRALGLELEPRLLVVLGGSQGASALNDWVRARLSYFAAEGIQVFCVTGLGKGHDGIVDLRTKGDRPIRAHFATFCDRMAELLSAADLVVARAGAGTLAELTRCETPAILVPYPQAADDHQRANAAYFAQEGGGLVTDQGHLAGLHTEVRGVIFDDQQLQRFRASLRRMDRANALDLMLADLEEITRRPGASNGGAHAVTA